ncbi:hypothetical protein MHYP_G00162320 [Metynnis hypsauchen]
MKQLFIFCLLTAALVQESDTITSSTGAPVPGPCESNPCPRDSRCEELFEDFRCLCRPGLFHDTKQKTCSRGKIFPSVLRWAIDFVSAMENKDSPEFKNMSEKIITALSETFKDQPGYIGSTVLELRRGSVIADVDTFFEVTAEVTERFINESLQNATKQGPLSGVEVKLNDACSTGYCDERTTLCNPNDGLATCRCREEYVMLNATEQSCYACPSGQKAVDSKTCEPCAFGYSGFNCNESYLLAVVITSSILGPLLLAALVTILVVTLRRPKTGIKSSHDSDFFSDAEFHKPPRIPRIPRANPNSSWEPTNLETLDSGSTHALMTKGQPENIAMEKYYNAYNDDSRSYGSQPPSRNGHWNSSVYGNRNGFWTLCEGELKECKKLAYPSGTSALVLEGMRPYYSGAKNVANGRITGILLYFQKSF